MNTSIKHLGKTLSTRLTYITLATVLLGLSAGLSSSAASASPVSSQAIVAGPGHRISASQNPQMQQQLSRQLNSQAASGSNSSIAFYNWSGYAATSSAAFNEAKSIYVQPTVTCPVAGAWTLFWVGFDGYNNGTVEQDGTAAHCGTANSNPTYYAWWEMYPTNTIQTMPLTVTPGNTIQAYVVYVASTKTYELDITNATTGLAYTKDTTCAANLTCARSSAEWIVERPTVNGSYAPLADWSTMNLTTDEASDSTVTTGSRRNPTTSNVEQPISAFNNTPINMVNDPYTGETLAAVGNLDQTGTIFTDTWKAAQ